MKNGNKSKIIEAYPPKWTTLHGKWKLQETRIVITAMIPKDTIEEYL
jgi:hypothetical protein